MREPPATDLGPRGFRVEFESTDTFERAGLPAQFRLPAAAAPAPAPRKRGRAAAARVDYESAAVDDLAGWLFETAGATVDSDILDLNRPAPEAAARAARMTEKAVLEDAEAMEIEDRLAPEACEPFLTSMRFGFWNRPSTQPFNNCYNYASNFASYTLAQPGRYTGNMYRSFDCGAVVAAAMSDGYLTDCRGSVRVVALGIWPGYDFHWWRLHPNGFWAHKVGWWPAHNTDNAGRILGGGLTPANCDRGPYIQFCGYYFAPLGVAVA
jgi:hypothetical protein